MGAAKAVNFVGRAPPLPLAFATSRARCKAAEAGEAGPAVDPDGRGASQGSLGRTVPQQPESGRPSGLSRDRHRLKGGLGGLERSKLVFGKVIGQPLGTGTT